MLLFLWWLQSETHDYTDNGISPVNIRTIKPGIMTLTSKGHIQRRKLALRTVLDESKATPYHAHTPISSLRRFGPNIHYGSQAMSIRELL